MFFYLKTAIASCALSLSALPALSQDLGQFDLAIGDRQYLFDMKDVSSDWSGSENFATVNLAAAPRNTERALFTALELGFDYMGGVVNNPEITLSRTGPDGGDEDYFSSRDNSSAVVTIDRFVVEDEVLYIDGNLSGTLGTTSEFGGNDGAAAPLSISGTFDITLPRAH